MTNQYLGLNLILLCLKSRIFPQPRIFRIRPNPNVAGLALTSKVSASKNGTWDSRHSTAIQECGRFEVLVGKEFVDLEFNETVGGRTGQLEKCGSTPFIHTSLRQYQITFHGSVE